MRTAIAAGPSKTIRKTVTRSASHRSGLRPLRPNHHRLVVQDPAL